MKKVVLKLNLHDDKVKQKAMKKVSGLPGIESISMDMKDKKLTVTGDIDPVNVVGKLRKICHTEIVSVGPAKDDYKKDDKKKDDKKKQEEKKYDNMKKDDQHFGPEFVYAYYPPQYMNNKYYARSAEEDPNSCVYKQWVCDKCSKGYAIHSDYEAHLKTCGDSWVGSFTEHQDACTVRRSQPDDPPPLQLQVHHSMCTELKKLVDRIAAIFPDIEAALPRCDSGIQSLCLLKSAMDKAKQLLEYCLESSKLYLALTGDAILSRCRKSKNLLEKSLCQVQTMIPVKSAEISHIIDDLRATRFMLDSSEEEARKALLDLLICRDTAAPDALASNEKKALQLAASRLHMASKTAMSVEMRAIKKLLAEVGEKDRNKRKILNYLLLLLKKYGRSVAREQIDHTPVGESSDPILSGDSGIRISTGADEGFLNCRRLATFYLKTVDLPLLLIPSRSIALNLRAECLVRVYLPGSNDALVQDLVNLKELDLSCSSFTRIPDLSRACKLQCLDLHFCKNLVDVSSIQYLTKLEYINLKGCTSLTCLPSLMALKFLLSLDVSDCINLRRLPPSLGCLSSLTALDLRNCKRIQNLPKGILKLKSVKTLLISGCSMLMEHASGPERMLIENQNPIAHSSLHALDEEVSMSYLPVDKYVSKIPLQQPEEERISSKCQSIASKDAVEPSSTTLDLERHKEVLKAYMNAPVEAIHQANAFYDIERTVDLLTRQSSNLHESASLHDLMCCLEELQENVPEIMSRMHDARVSKASIHVKSAQLLSSSVQSEGHYNGLAAQLSVISDEEEDLDAEIDRLLAKKRELLD